MCPSRENILASTSVGEGEHPGQVVFWRLGMDDNNTPYGDAFATVGPCSAAHHTAVSSLFLSNKAICGNDPRIVGPSTVAFEARGAVWHNTDAIAAVVTDNSLLLVDLVQVRGPLSTLLRLPLSFFIVWNRRRCSQPTSCQYARESAGFTT